MLSERTPGRLARLGLFLLAVAAVQLAGTAAASASVTGAVSEFKFCPISYPLTASDGGLVCSHSEANSGTITIGKSTVKLVNVPDSVDMGFYDPANGGCPLCQSAIVTPTGSPMFYGPPQPVPGGLLGLTGKGTPLNNVNASVELASAAKQGKDVDRTETTAFFAPINAILGGTLLKIPVMVHLSNPVLGKACTIGSVARPIDLNLQGSNAGNLAFFDGANGLLLTLTLSDNTFSVPGATGCGPGGLLDKAVDTRVGLPSPPGKNDIVLNAASEVALACYPEGTC